MLVNMNMLGRRSPTASPWRYGASSCSTPLELLVGLEVVALQHLLRGDVGRRDILMLNMLSMLFMNVMCFEAFLSIEMIHVFYNLPGKRWINFEPN